MGRKIKNEIKNYTNCFNWFPHKGSALAKSLEVTHGILSATVVETMNSK